MEKIVNIEEVKDQEMVANQPYSKILKQKLMDEKKGGNLNYTEKRILKDLEEFEFNVNPEMGISARPLNDTIYKWHANIKGMADTPYEGGIFHFEISIPGDYPNKPPVIEALTPLTNNFFIAGKYRSEMIEDDWCSGYSLFSVLLQIQFGLFDYQHSQQQNIKHEATTSGTYKCKSCDHNGAAKVYPPFESALENGPVNYASKTEEEKLVEDTYCFHTRMNVKETTQGTGVAFSRQMRTTEVARIYTTIDLVSQKAFKEGLRKSVNKKRFSHWLPLYFKDTCNVEKTVDLFRKHLSDIAAGSKDKFDENMILNVMPKLLLTHIVQLMNDKAYSSIKGIRMLNYFHRAFIFMLDQHPQVQYELENQVERFINDDDFRNKDNTPDLGMIVAMVCASRKFRFSDIIKPLIKEKLARHVFWVLKEVPEFENITDENFNQQFIEKVFKATEGGWRLLMFLAYYNNYIIDKNQDKRDLDEIVEEYDKRYSRLYYKIEEELQREVDSIKLVTNFNDFYKKIGLPALTNNELKETLINSVVTSKEKGYHGGYDIYYPLPDIKDQVKDILKERVTALSFYNPFEEENAKVMDDEEDFVKYIKQGFSWTNEYFLDENTITPELLALESDLRNSTSKTNLNVKGNFQNRYHDLFSDSIKQASSNRPYRDLTWKDLFIKLDLEAFIHYNEYAQDEESLKNYLEVCAPHIRGLVLRQPCLESDKLSYSAYTKIIEACASTLEKLVLVGFTEVYQITQGFLTCVRLGFKTAKEIKLRDLELHYVNYKETYGEPMPLDTFEKIDLVSLLKVVTTVDSLRFSNISFSVVSTKALLEAVNAKALKEISLVNCGVDKYVCKELMNLLKENDKIEIFDISRNKIEHGLQTVFKVLAGKESLRVLDLSYNFLTHVQGFDDHFEKFITTTPNIEYLDFSFSNIHKNLADKSLEAIGQLKKLKGISFASSTCKMTQDNLKSLAKAFVASKNNEAPLEAIILRGCFNTYPDYEAFFEGLTTLSPAKEMENLEGFELVDDVMGESTKALFKYLDISLGTFESGFEQSKLKKGEFPGLKYIFTLFESLNMDSCKLTEKDARMIKYCFKQAGLQSSLKALTLSNNSLGSKGAEALATLEIEELDLSNCKLGVGGASAFSKVLNKNHTLKRLNLYNNSIKVEGCRFLAKSLEENKTLELLDIGCNKIRNKGFEALACCLSNNLKVLAAKSNQIKDRAFNEFMHKYTESENSTLKSLLLASNDISMYAIKLAEESVGEKLYIDLSLKLENHNDRTLFLCGIVPTNTKPLLKKYFDSKGCGVIENIEVIEGREKKKGKRNIFGFVRFAHKNAKMRVVKSLKDVEEKAINPN